MRKNFLTCLWLSVFPLSSWADLATLCRAGVPHFEGEVVKGDVNMLPVYVESDDATLNQNKHGIYQGNVEIKQGNRKLTTSQAEIFQDQNADKVERRVKLPDSFIYQDNLVRVAGENASFNLNSLRGQMDKTNYQFMDRQGRGIANSIAVDKDYRILRNSTFTTCLPDDQSWKIKASEMKQHIKDEYAEMWNARVLVQDIPIFYFPYIQIPIGDRRRTGLLAPTFGKSSRDGFWFTQPLYINILPYMDATLTPKYMSRRGWQAIGEYRLLTPLGKSIFAGEYLHSDRSQLIELRKHSRNLLYWANNPNFNNPLQLKVDYTKVSDRTYFDDFDSNYGSSTDGYASQQFQISYNQENYNLKLSSLRFQLLDVNATSAYRAAPQLDFNYYQDEIGGWLDFHLFTQGVLFENSDKNLPSAWRFHLQPELSLPINSRYGGIEFKTALYATHYEQRQGDGTNPMPVQKQVNRFIPEASVKVNTLLAKEFQNGYTQTIEPYASYKYRPYRNQGMIGPEYGYDSSAEVFGLDRILSNNHILAGVTTRVFDDNNQERFNISFEQFYYFEDEKAQADYIKNRKGTFDWNLKTNYLITNQLNFNGEIRYKADYKRIANANATLQFSPTKDHIVQLNYRYINFHELNGYPNDIQQLGIVVGWSFADHWAIVGKNYYDLAIRQNTDQFIGIQYNTCCWSAGVGFKRYVESRVDQQVGEIHHNNGFTFNFELRGFSNEHPTGVKPMLEKGKLPFFEPFSL